VLAIGGGENMLPTAMFGILSTVFRSMIHPYRQTQLSAKASTEQPRPTGTLVDNHTLRFSFVEVRAASAGRWRPLPRLGSRSEWIAPGRSQTQPDDRDLLTTLAVSDPRIRGHWIVGEEGRLSSRHTPRRTRLEASRLLWSN